GYFSLLNSDRFRIGSAVEVRLGRGGPSESLIRGEVTSVEMEARPNGDTLLAVRGYDRAHRLHRERRTRTFVQVFDADVVRAIARESGLTPEVDEVGAAGPLHEHLFQDNQTDWELLRARAADLGCEVGVRDQRLFFRRPVTGGEPPEHALFGSLLKIRLRMSAPAQVSEVVVRGWDPQRKQAIVGLATRASDYIQPAIGEIRTGAEVAQPFGAGRYVVTAHNVSTQDEAQKLAQAVYDEIAGEFIQLEGACLGDPRVRAGQPIRLTNLGQRFSGTYYVTAVTHRMTPDEGYVTHFTVSGRQPITMAALLAGGSGNGSAGAVHRGFQGLGQTTGRYGGVVSAVVTNNKPTDARYAGQVKVKFPWLSDSEESRWARIAAPSAGSDRGFFFLPEINDEVLVAFEHGDINRPYVVGGLWNGKDLPPRDARAIVATDGRVKQRVIKSRTGHTVILDDSDETPGITIVDRTEKNKITLDSKSNVMTIAAEGDLHIAARGTVRLTGRALAFEATAEDAIITGRNATLEARSGAVTARGVRANIEATAGKATVKGAAGADVEAAAGILTLKGGPLVNIN
ncbi:MAG TPA: VgrG-related protein, partial [Chloroflexota bacterium]|nr:VgrG-related protein [Chloroflexota bacterium]